MKAVLLRILSFLRLYEASVLHEYPRSYREELERQMNKLIPAISIWGSFQWLLFIKNDVMLHNDAVILPALRVGLTLVCIGTLLYYFFSRSSKRGYFGGLAVMAYLEIATAVITGRVEAEPVYMSGYSLALVLIVLVPLDIRHSFAIISASLATFFSILFFRGVKIESAYHEYNLLNLMSAGVAAYLMSYLIQAIRKRSWEKSIIIENEREKSDRLLRNTLPNTIADELKNNGRVAPQLYEEATVLFTDFVGFTQIAEKMSPEELIHELDNCFSYFDQVAKRYKLEKLKTIGDSYMCAGGIPSANKTNALDCVLAALEIRAFMQQMKEIKAAQNLPYWELRIGIHTGPLVAGVIGESKFAYDVWGDTVNTASRMEASGIPGEINISATSYAQVKYFFNCEYRGRLGAKNKGEMEMYFVHTLKERFSADISGRTPNTKFFEIYAELARGKKIALKKELQYLALSA
jgi:class 3 adenylate cyclase